MNRKVFISGLVGGAFGASVVKMVAAQPHNGTCGACKNNGGCQANQGLVCASSVCVPANSVCGGSGYTCNHGKLICKDGSAFCKRPQHRRRPALSYCA